LTTFSQASPALHPSQEAERFLRLLADLGHMQQELLDEARALRARVAELEARVPEADPSAQQARRRP
jgi:hypothetical protein